ncbi:MAG: hypothetical protein A3G80_00995 [Betaproteobacteria bacterium RIFCSPLOWO2_12_FULL_62_13b]|nr:MAG: hypothetical protein A3G80_00995 [Betaproteobacteria bacterium RIFCSPLOWO2_12_FULL_62_13b]
MKRGLAGFQPMLLRNAFRWGKRALKHIHSRIFPVPLSAEQAAFVERNLAFWNGECGAVDKAGSGYVFVRVEGHPVLFLSDASFATIAGRAKGLRPLFVTSGFKNSVSTMILESYPGAAFVYLRSLRWLGMRLIAVLQAVRLYRSIQSPRDLLNLQVDGIRFGDVIYDAVLAEGYATISTIDYRTFIVLQRFYFLRSFIRYVIKRYNLQAAVFAHTVGLQSAVFGRYLLQAGIEVINRIGSHQILLKKYQGLADVGTYALKPEPRYLALMLERDDGTILRKAEEYLERRFSQQVRHLAVDAAFDPSKRIYDDRRSFCQDYCLDPEKPIAFVMLHVFNDYPHSHFAKPMIFQDYYDWFIRTLELAGEVKSANWIFKEHPAADHYITRDVDLKRVFQEVKYNNVRFLDRQADFNARSIPHLAQAILTCVGTAGLEYSTLGIPCILGGESGYDGLGFTIEPKDEGEYAARLRRIDSLERLSGQQIRAAKVVAYFFFCVMESAVYHFCPRFTDTEICEWNGECERRLWMEAARRLADEDSMRLMKTQIEELSGFLIDSSWTQYVDLRQFPHFGNGKAKCATGRGQSK